MRAALERVLQRDRADRVWAQACLSAGINRPGPAMDLSELYRVADCLVAAGGLVGLLGVSLRVRLDTYRTLNEVADIVRPTQGMRDDTN